MPQLGLAKCGGISIDTVSFEEVLRTVLRSVQQRTPLRIHTLNVDHTILAQSSESFLHSIQTAQLVVADGMPIVWILRLLGWRFAERITGADLTIRILEQFAVKVAFVGGAHGVAERAKAHCETLGYSAKIVYTASPRRDEILTAQGSHELIAGINSSGPDVLFVAFGTPLQEEWLARYEAELRVPVRIGVGAAIDFLAGEQQRAPVWVQRSGLEWLYRMSHDPARLVRRYILRDWRFVSVAARWIIEARHDELDA